MVSGKRHYNDAYAGEYLNHIAFPLGGMGAGMICFEGTGALSHVSLRGHPDVFNEPQVFSAVYVRAEHSAARVLEGPVPSRKIYGLPGSGNGAGDRAYGLPRWSGATFTARFPFATVRLDDSGFPLQVRLTAWSPFVPGDSDGSSLPVAALEYQFVNSSDRPVDVVYSFHARNFIATESGGQAVLPTNGGFILWQPGSDERPWDQGAFSAVVDDEATKVNCAWFRGGWYDALTMVWKTIEDGESPAADPVDEGGPSPGGSLYVPFQLGSGEEKLLRLRLAWHVPHTDIRLGQDVESDESCCVASCDCGARNAETPSTHTPWYAGVFEDIQAITQFWRANHGQLRNQSALFSECFYDTSLPPEVVEAIAANLTILKSPTVLRQTDGRLWAWEGCRDEAGCCAGTCTHVWNYAQAIPHLFPDMERSLRQTEFDENQDERGHQVFRASLPVRATTHDFHSAADGQLGGMMKVHREWRICGDSEWLRGLWPKVKQSLDYCIETWDPEHKGILEEPHHNTYDIEFWGPDGMCTSFYLGALKAAVAMAEAVSEDIPLYAQLLERGRAYMESMLWNGEYFIQQIQWEELRAGNPAKAQSFRTNYSPEALDLLRKEGPKYQYGNGCLSDGVLGAWMAEMSSVGEFLDRQKVDQHLLSVHRYNFRQDLSEHPNPQRPTYALGKEGGLLLCSWPQGDALSIPFVYSNEVWTGIEYQVASHLMLLGHVEEGLEIVRALRARYDGRVRNPFNEYECGHWYARAMASYGMLQGLTGIRYDAIDKVLYIEPSVSGDFRAFLCAATGFGTVGVREGEPFVEVKQGTIPFERIEYGRCTSDG